MTTIYDEQAQVFIATVSNGVIIDDLVITTQIFGYLNTTTNNAIISSSNFYIDSNQISECEMSIVIYGIYCPSISKLFNVKIKNNNNAIIRFTNHHIPSTFKTLKNKLGGEIMVSDVSIELTNDTNFSTINNANINVYNLSTISLSHSNYIDDIDVLLDATKGYIAKDMRFYASIPNKGICIKMIDVFFNNIEYTQ